MKVIQCEWVRDSKGFVLLASHGQYTMEVGRILEWQYPAEPGKFDAYPGQGDQGRMVAGAVPEDDAKKAVETALGVVEVGEGSEVHDG